MRRRRERGGAGAVFAILGVVVVLLAGTGAGAAVYARSQLDAPSDSHDQQVDVEVRSGEGVDAVTADLDARGLIRSQFWFSQYARLRGLGDSLHSGHYRLDTGMAAGTIIDALSGPPTIPRTQVSLPEGLTAEQMGHRLESSALGITQQAYLREVRTGSFSEPFLQGRPPGSSLEGFLFPDTYEIQRGTSAHDVVQMQLDNFQHRALVLGAIPTANLYQLVTIASILEREAKFAEDQPLVASVIDNRLSRGMPLEVDATVLYGLHLMGRDTGAVDTRTDTPYNSYLHAGLPPTPISNPGLRTLQAAAHPQSTSYLYYVSDGCGHNHYATSAQEHSRQVQEYVGSACPGGSPSASPGG